MNANAFCFVSISPVRAEASDKSEIVTQLLFGELIEVLDTKDNWSEIKTFHDQYSGFIDTKHFIKLSQKEVKRWLDNQTLLTNHSAKLKTPWGLQHITKGAFVSYHASFNIGNFTFQLMDAKEDKLPKSPYDFSLNYLNSPYLWGGKTPFGIDCSGFTQMVFRFYHIQLPRDASQQVDDGSLIEFEDLMENDLAFFENKDGKIIHVGIIGKNNAIIHAAGHVRIDHLTKEGIFNKEKEMITHRLAKIKRFI